MDKCSKCRHFVPYAPKKHWDTPKGPIVARLCQNCAKELDEIYMQGWIEGAKQKAEAVRAMKAITRDKNKIAQAQWDELKARIKHR